MSAIGSLVSGKYEIIRLIGEGGMSRVYLAMDVKLNKQWAIKEIKPVNDPSEQAIIRESLVTETNMLKALDHPALPRIVDLVNENGTLYVIMDYIEGEPLSRILKEQARLSQDEVIEIAKQLCDVLDYLHQNGIVYRDMKPGNVMLKPDGTVKLIDFGIARLKREETEAERGKLDDTTMLGTKGYAAPEQFGGLGQTDARTDVYCLGATLYHLITGKSPAEPPYVMYPIRQVDASLSPGLEKILSKATQQNPEKRYQSCAEMLYELEHFETADDAHRRKLKNTWNAFVAVCAAAVVGVAVGVGGLVMAELNRSQDYSFQVELAGKATDQKEAAAHYLDAISIKPAQAEAYQGLVALYKKDGSFSTEEEKQLLEAVMPNLPAIKADGVAYADLSYDIGKLYWYYYDYALDAGDNRLTRIKSAARWMSDAAAQEGFENSGLAALYSKIAAFNNDIVSRINEGGDAGYYEPYFRELQRLNEAVAGEENDVVLLETAALTSDALGTYARKFRADGVSQAELEALEADALANAKAVHPTTEKLDQEQQVILEGDEPVCETIRNAFVDARTSE